MSETKIPVDEQQASENVTATESSGQQGKVFTQDDVNRIVSERLSRERAKGEPSETDKREADLTARETALKCREFIIQNSKSYPAGLADVLDTSDFDTFKSNADKLTEMFRNFNQVGQQPRGFVTIGGDGKSRPETDSIAAAFKRKN